MNKIETIVAQLAEPVVRELGLELWDVEYVREAGEWYLRVYIDKPDTGVFIDDCEAVSRALDPILDEADPIETSYTFEVSSAGAERRLKRPSDFQRFLGSFVEVRLYKASEGSKTHTGTLRGYEDGAVTLSEGGRDVTFDKTQVASVRLRIQ